MGKPLKILAICGMGLGSSMILRMQVEKAARSLGLETKVDLADISTARSLVSSADIVVTSKELADRVGTVPGKLITITNFMDLAEMTRKLEEAVAES